MGFGIEAADALLERRNHALEAADADASAALWSDDCVVEGPAHLLEGNEQLRQAMRAAFSAMRPVCFRVLSRALAGRVIFYEWAAVWQLRQSGERKLLSGMTWHEIDEHGRFKHCREYFDPQDRVRESAAAHPDIAQAMNGNLPAGQRRQS